MIRTPRWSRMQSGARLDGLKRSVSLIGGAWQDRSRSRRATTQSGIRPLPIHAKMPSRPPIGLNRFRRRASQHGQRGRVWLRGQDCAQAMAWVAWPEFIRPASTLASLRASSFFLFFEAAGPAASLSSSIRSASACCLASSSLRMRSVSGLVALLVLCCKLVNMFEGAQLVPYRF